MGSGGALACRGGTPSVVMLAAGRGTRLAVHNGGRPKWLTEVGGAPIAAHQLRAVERHLGADTPVVVVGGHGAGAVAAWLESFATTCRIELVVNDRYDELNNWFSLLLALDHAGDDDVILFNSDLMALPDWYGAFLAAATDTGALDGPGAGGLLAIDDRRPLSDEAMKVAVETAPDGSRRCTAIGKVGVDAPAGEYVGMAAIGAAHVGAVAETLRSFQGLPERANDWYEAGFRVHMERDRLFTAWSVPSSMWVEIDDGVDLATARRLFA